MIIKLDYPEFNSTAGSIETYFGSIRTSNRLKRGFYGACRYSKFIKSKLDYNEFNSTAGSIETSFGRFGVSNQLERGFYGACRYSKFIKSML